MSSERLAEARNRLGALREIRNPLEVQLRVAAVLSGLLREQGEPVVVGAARCPSPRGARTCPGTWTC